MKPLSVTTFCEGGTRYFREVEVHAEAARIHAMSLSIECDEDCESLKCGMAYGLEYGPGDLACNCLVGQVQRELAKLSGVGE
jgi:hypothetical protein